MIIADTLVSGAVGLCGSGVIVAFIQGLFSRGTSRQQKELEDHRIWYQESHQHYETAKKETNEARKECADCKAELRAVRTAIYGLLEDLEDQIVPMLQLPYVDHVETGKAVRASIRKVRDTI